MLIKEKINLIFVLLNKSWWPDLFAIICAITNTLIIHLRALLFFVLQFHALSRIYLYVILNCSMVSTYSRYYQNASTEMWNLLHNTNKKIQVLLWNTWCFQPEYFKFYILKVKENYLLKYFKQQAHHYNKSPHPLILPLA